MEFLNLSVFEICIAILIIFIAYTIKGLSGFGSGLVAIPLLAFYLPVTFIVPVLGLLSYNGTFIQSLALRRQASWPAILPLIPFTFAGIFIAVWLLSTVDAHILVFCLGLFVFCYAIYSMLPAPDIRDGKFWAVICGSLGGLVGALFGTGGPFYVVYLKIRQLDKSQFRATITSIFLIDGGARIIGYAGRGLYTPQVLVMAALLFPVLLLGMYVGHHLHINIDQKRFNQVVSTMLMISGMMLMYKALNV